MFSVGSFASGFDHPEDLAFDRAGALWCGGELGQVYRLEPGAEAPVEITRHGGETRGIAFDADGSAIVCNHVLSTVFRVWADGRSDEIPCVAAGRRIQVPNHAAFGCDGSLFVSDSCRFPEPDGYIYRWPPGGGEPEIFHSGPFGYPNGLAVDAEGDWLYIIETAHDGVVRIPLDTPEGPIGQVAGGLSRMPDGMAFDVDGGLWVATFAGDAIYRIDRSGSVELVAHDDRAITLNRPANVAFGGDAFGQLFIANLGSNFISVLDAGIAGQPLWGGLHGYGSDVTRTGSDGLSSGAA
jgi:gluconolactonase